VIAYFRFQIWIQHGQITEIHLIFIQGQNKKFKFVLQFYLMISVENKSCSIFISSMIGMLAVEVYAFCQKSYQTSAYLVFITFYGEVLLL